MNVRLYRMTHIAATTPSSQWQVTPVMTQREHNKTYADWQRACTLSTCDNVASVTFARSEGGELYVCRDHVAKVQQWVGGCPTRI
jgi:hypothetical protein